MNINYKVAIDIPNEPKEITKIDDDNHNFDNVQNKMNHNLFSDFVIVLLHAFSQKMVLFDYISQLFLVV